MRFKPPSFESSKPVTRCLQISKIFRKIIKSSKMGKRKHDDKPKAEGEFDLGHKYLKSIHVQANQKRLIVVLSGAQLETVKVSEIPSHKRVINNYNHFRLEIHLSF